MLNEHQIQENWEKFREIINTEFTGERKDALNKMYDYFENRIIFTPASGKEHFHNAFPGGYIDHVLRVYDLIIKQKDLWEENGAMINFTREELVFSALHHDLYKIGDLTHDYYVPNDSQWHREKMGMIYKFNDNLMNDSSHGRTHFLLAHFKISCTQLERMAIDCADGMYSPDNEFILKQHEASKQIRSNLLIIIHHADMLATRIEYDRWFKVKSSTTSYNPMGASRSEEQPTMYKKQNLNKISNIVTSNPLSEKQKQLFEDLFD